RRTERAAHPHAGMTGILAGAAALPPPRFPDGDPPMIPRPAMLYRLGLTLAAALALAACSQETPAPASPAGTTAPASTAPAPTVAPAAGATTARTPGAVMPPVGAAPVAGTDYVVIAGGTPFKAGSDKIEVVEVFGYTCPHCSTFEPLVSAWSARLPADVEF